MADTKITVLTAITTVDPAVDVLPIVDISDTTMAASGTTKKITSNQILGAGGTATLASATITGDLTVDTNTLKVDSTNNRVGIGTATPARSLEIVGSFQSSAGWALVGSPPGLGGATRYIGGAGGTDSWYFNALTGGSHLWAFGESTAMTLNSTGLGVGVASPDFKFVVNGTQAVPSTSGSSATDGSLRIGAPGTGLCIDSGVTAATDVYGWFQARSRTNYATNFNLVFNPNGGNVGIGYIPTAGSFSKVLFIGTGTEPTAGATGAVQYFTSTRSASNTIPAILCEGSGVTNAGITSTTVTNKIAIKVNGTIYYLLATTSAA